MEFYCYSPSLVIIVIILILLFPQGLLGTFRHIGADTSVHRYLWNPFYCYSNQYIHYLGHGGKYFNIEMLMSFCFAAP